MMKLRDDFAVETRALEAIPAEEKKSWVSIAFIWTGQVVCVPALMIGGMISAGLAFWESLAAMTIGYAITVSLMILIAVQSAQTGRPAMVAVARALGDKGASFSISLIMVISLVGFYAYQTVVCAGSFVGILNSSLGIEFPINASCIIWGGLMLITAYVGIGMQKILNIISVPLLFIFLIYGVVAALGGGGTEKLLAYTPSEPMPFLSAVTISVGVFISGAATAGDYNRYSKDGKSAALSCFFGILPAGIGALACGSVMAIISGNYDITVIFASTGLPIIGLIVLILATWTTNVGNAYSAGIAAVKTFNLKDDKRAIVTGICGILGILLSLGGIVNYFLNFLFFLTYFVTPICAVLIADYWIMGKGRAEGWNVFPGVNWIGIFSWLVGTAVIYINANYIFFFIPEIIGIVVTTAIYTILCKVIKSPKYNPFAPGSTEHL